MSADIGTIFTPGAGPGQWRTLYERTGLTGVSGNRQIIETLDAIKSTFMIRGLWLEVDLRLDDATGLYSGYTFADKTDVDNAVSKIVAGWTLTSGMYGDIIPADTPTTQLRDMALWMFGAVPKIYDTNNVRVVCGFNSGAITSSGGHIYAVMRIRVPIWIFSDASDRAWRGGNTDVLGDLFCPWYGGIMGVNGSQLTVLWGALDTITLNGNPWTVDVNNTSVRILLEGEDRPDGAVDSIPQTSPLSIFPRQTFSTDSYKMPGDSLILGCYRTDRTINTVLNSLLFGGTPGPSPTSALRYTVISGAGTIRDGAQPLYANLADDTDSQFDRLSQGQPDLYAFYNSFYNSTVKMGPRFGAVYGPTVIAPPSEPLMLANGLPMVQGQYYGGAVATGTCTHAYCGVRPMSQINTVRQSQRAASGGARPPLMSAELAARIGPYLPLSYISAVQAGG